MNLTRKLELAYPMVTSISRHDDETIEHVNQALDLLQAFIDAERAAIALRRAAQAATAA